MHDPGRFSQALASARASGKLPLISEVKCKSPKEGDLLRGRDPVALARTMEAAGAALVSVVTEPEHFGGSLQLLREVTSAVVRPVLRKDFVKCAGDIRATQEAGASCLLLIVAMLEWPLLVELHHEAHQRGLETLVEVHNQVELAQALALELDLLGINNRDIQRLERDGGTVANTLELLQRVPAGIRVISESAIAGPDEAQAAIAAGAAGVLVGTSILQATDAGDAVRRFVSAGAGI